MDGTYTLNSRRAERKKQALRNFVDKSNQCSKGLVYLHYGFSPGKVFEYSSN